MIDTQHAIRKAFYQALSTLTYNSVAVPVFDEMADTTANVYVILSTQTTTDYPTLNGQDTNETILIDIVHRSSYAVTKDAIDDVGSQVLSAVSAGLPVQAGFQFSCVRIESINTVRFEVGMIRKLIRFSLKVNQ